MLTGFVMSNLVPTVNSGRVASNVLLLNKRIAVHKSENPKVTGAFHFIFSGMIDNLFVLRFKLGKSYIVQQVFDDQVMV